MVHMNFHEIKIQPFIINDSEKKALLKTLDYLEERAAKGSKEHALNILNNAQNTEPATWDKL